MSMISSKWANQSHYNPESSTSISISPVAQRKKNRNEGCVSGKHTNKSDHNSLEKRYLALQQMYKDLLVKTSDQCSSVKLQTK